MKPKNLGLKETHLPQTLYDQTLIYSSPQYLHNLLLSPSKFLVRRETENEKTVTLSPSTLRSLNLSTEF